MQSKPFFLFLACLLPSVVAVCNDGGGYNSFPLYFSWFQCAPGNYYTQSDYGTKTQAQASQEC